MSETIQDLYTSFSEQMEPIQEDNRYFRYLFEMAQASGTTIEQRARSSSRWWTRNGSA